MDAGIYVRLSENPDGTRTGLTSQEDDCRELAERRGWNVVEVYADDDTSASKGNERPAYERMLADVRAGRIKGIIYQTNSRLTRRVREYLDIIDLVQETGVKLASVRSGDHDLTTADGRAVALTLASWDAAEAERTAERVKRNIEHRKRQGKALGSRHRTYGYTRDWQVIPEEAAIVKEVFERIAAGEGLWTVCKAINAKGSRTTTGKEFGPNTISAWFKRPTYTGVNEFGVQDREPIVDRKLFDAAAATRRPGTPAHNARKHLLTNIAICGECHTQMKGQSSDGGRYKCAHQLGGCGMSVKKAWIDDAVSREVLRKHQEGVTVPEAVDRSAEIEQAEATIKQIQDSDLEFTDKVQWIQTERDKIRAWRAEEAESVSTEVHAVLETYDQWAENEVGRNRMLVQRYVSSVEVLRDPRFNRPRDFNPKRVLIHWRDGTTTHPEAGVLEERYIS